jgi:hypothetical protein
VKMYERHRARAQARRAGGRREETRTDAARATRKPEPSP